MKEVLLLVAPWLFAYVLAFAVSFGVMGVLALLFSMANWHMLAIGIGFLLCGVVLCTPDEVMNRFRRSRHQT